MAKLKPGGYILKARDYLKLIKKREVEINPCTQFKGSPELSGSLAKSRTTGTNNEVL